MCILLELSDSLYAGLLQHVYVCVHAGLCVVQRICDSLPEVSCLAFAAKLRVLQRICDSLLKLSHL